jgi:hypothetical protein
MKKPLTIKKRVDLLLKHGVNEPKKWATVCSYKEPDLDSFDCDYDIMRQEWQRLHAHYLEETSFLFDMLRALVKRYEQLDEQFANSMTDPSYEDD